MKKCLFLIIFFCTGNFIMALPTINKSIITSTSDPLKKIVKEIAKANIFETPATAGYAGTPSQQGIRYQQLLKSASIDELTELATKNKNAVVRLYAFYALVSKLKNIPKEIIEQFKNDTTIINVLNGNIADKTPLNVVAQRCLY